MGRSGRAKPMPCVLLLAALALSGCGQAMRVHGTIDGEPPSHARGPYRTLPIGLCEDYPEETRRIARAREDFELLRASGITHLRVSLGWDGIEPRDDEFDWEFWDQFIRIASDEYGIVLLPYVCYTPEWAADPGDNGEPFTTRPPADTAEFREFVEAAARRYADRIDTWEIWNEPDNPQYWTGSTAEFARLLITGSEAVRAGDPSARVVLGGLAWDVEKLRELLAIEGVEPAIDIVNLHSYLETWSHEPAEALERYIGRAADLVAQHGKGEALWMAEVGYSTFRRGDFVSSEYSALHEYEHTPEYAADHLLKTVAMLAAMPALELLAWYEVRDLPAEEEVIGDVNNRHLGVLTVDGTPKPALDALVFARRLFQTPFRNAGERVLVTRAAGSRAEVRAFEREDGSVFCIAWLPAHVPGARAERIGSTAVSAARPERETITLAISDAAATVVEYNARGFSRGMRTLTQGPRGRLQLRHELRGGETVGLVFLPGVGSGRD
jgi:polysaccharide biosynthesis protein PslG